MGEVIFESHSFCPAIEVPGIDVIMISMHIL